MSPERSGSPQDDQAATPKMSVPASPVAGTPTREAQSPISLLLAVAQSQSTITTTQTRNGDDDLTNLAWLHERDLLKGMNLVNPSPMSSVHSTPVKYLNNNHILSDQLPTSDYVDESSAAESSNSSLNSPVSHQNHRKHPHNIPYDPLVHTANKPPYSFSCLIFMAIEDSEQKALPVKEIYAWILEHFPYFRNAPTGWKNSVRHNLSLNKCFQKVEKAPNLGKGSLWTVDPQYKPNLIQALTRSPFHPCSTLDPSAYFNNKSKQSPSTPTTDKNNTSATTNNNNNNSRLPNPELFPYLSKTLAATEMKHQRGGVKTEGSDDSLDAVDAAAVMLSLKNGPRYRQKKEKTGVWQVITTSPSQDHTYSAASGVVVPCDEAFESDEDRFQKSSVCRKIDFEDDEERKIKEGAETLLNLAGITTRKRTVSCTAWHADAKKAKLFEEGADDDERDMEEEEEGGQEEQKPAHFRPRLLRSKKKDGKQKAQSNNEDEWVKHRRELEINQQR